jgi:hypothetical protein
MRAEREVVIHARPGSPQRPLLEAMHAVTTPKSTLESRQIKVSSGKSHLSVRPQCGANVKELTGHRFGKLVVLERAGSRGTSAAWLCLCDCGVKKVVTRNSLRAGDSESCGCSRKTGANSRPSYKCRLSPGEAARRNILKGYKYSAKCRGIAWDLDDPRFYSLIDRPCFYCGMPPQKVRKLSRNGQATFNGVDRVDNDGGYTSDNTVTCCHVCNHAKCKMSQVEFKEWIVRVYSYLTSGLGT